MAEFSDLSTASTSLTTTFVAPFEDYVSVNASVKERVHVWFGRRLMEFEGHDSLICLLVCLPLIERFIVWQVSNSGSGVNHGFTGPKPETNPLCKKLGAFLGTSAEGAQAFYVLIRCGFLHRGLPNKQLKSGERFETTLTPEMDKLARCVEFTPPTSGGRGRLQIWVWKLRDKVCKDILTNNSAFWTKDQTSFMGIQIMQP